MATTARGSTHDCCAVGLFARAPIPGRTKTRLIPLLGPEGAAAFHRASLLDTVSSVDSLGFRSRLFLSPLTDRSRVRDLGIESPILGQGGGNLGTRMARALAGLTRESGVDRAFLLGTDSPDLPKDVLHAAFRSLAKFPAVLVPAVDGGYCLIGVRRDDVDAATLSRSLRGVPWSTDLALAATIDGFLRNGIEPKLLGPWWDVDEPEDYRALCARIRIARALGQEIPARTADFIDSQR